MKLCGCIPVFLMTMILIVLVLSAGCSATTIGDVAYTGKEIVATVENSGPVSNTTYMQVTIYRISGFSQEEYRVVSAPVRLVNGTNMVEVPAELAPGTYKLNVYLIRNGERSSAVIRDIRV